jgi:hypothetical protein
VSEMLRLHSYIRSMKHVKILSYKVTTLHFMTDISIYIYIYIYKGGGTHTVVCTAHLYSTKHTVVFGPLEV